MKAIKFIGNTPVVVKVSLTIEKQKLGWTNVGHTFPKSQIVLTTVRENCPETLYVEYFCNRVKTYCYVPKDFKMIKMRGKLVTSMLKEYQDFQINNLKHSLIHSGMYLGSDPEIFVEDKKKEQIIPAFNFLPDKKKPIISINNNVYWDGFQAEFTTRADTCLAWQVDSVQNGLRAVLQEARKHNKDAVLSIQTTMDIPFNMLQDAKQEHVEFGCMPSFNAYGMKGIAGDGRNVHFRSAGGHIHFGVKKFTEKEAEPIVKALDMILGVECVSLFAKYDNPKRRSMYGLAGEYRLPPHGIEYRVLSNAWMYHPLIMNVVFDLARKVFVFGQKGLHQYWKATEAETIKVINTCDVAGAQEILKRNKELFLSIMDVCYGERKDSELIMEMFLNGMQSVLETPEDLVKNWNIDTHWQTHSDGTGKNWRFSREILHAKKKVA